MRLNVTLKFDRPIPENAYIVPGGYEVETGTGLIQFDFNESHQVDMDAPDTVGFTLRGLDLENFPEATMLEEALRNGTLKNFTEFFVYTGEKGEDPEVNLVKVLGAAFELNDGALQIPFKQEWLDKINADIANNLKSASNTTSEPSQPRLKAVAIQWDVDDDSSLEALPDEIEIPQEIIDEAKANDKDLDEAISDYITDLTGFCHNGFDLKELGGVANAV